MSLVTINKHLTMLDRAITYTHKEYHTPDLPVVSLKLEGVPKNQVKVWCSEEEISKLFAALNSERTVNVSGSKIGAPLSSVYNQYAGKKRGRFGLNFFLQSQSRPGHVCLPYSIWSGIELMETILISTTQSYEGDAKEEASLTRPLL